MLNNKLISIFIFIFIFIFCSFLATCSNQSKKPFPIIRTDKNSTIKVSIQELIELFKISEDLFKEKKIQDFTQNENILIILLHNSERFFPLTNKQILELYNTFKKNYSFDKYAKTLSDTYEWTPNKGMGMYFPDFDIELGGTPTYGWNYFEIKN